MTDKYRKRGNELAALGYNCGQSTVLAFAEVFDLDFETTRRMLTNYGCGVCAGDICGAMAGAAIVLGLCFEGDGDAAWDALAEVRKKFLALHPGIDCREILGYNISEGLYQKALDEYAFYHFCRPAITDACELLTPYVEAYLTRKESAPAGVTIHSKF